MLLEADGQRISHYRVQSNAKKKDEGGRRHDGTSKNKMDVSSPDVAQSKKKDAS
jgi:hypothetical protein